MGNGDQRTAWVYVLIASIFEIVWAIGLKYSMGWSRLWPSAITVGAYVASLGFLALGVRSLPVGTAYAVWTGIGVAGTALFGMTWLGESRDLPRIFCLLLIIAGVIGLRLTARS